jgi:hypothetical protein
MSRIALSALVCALAVCSAPTGAADEPLTERQKEKNIQDALRAKVKFDGPFDVRDMTLADVIKKLGKDHGIEFAVAEDEFKAAGATNIRERKSYFDVLDTKGLTVPQFLNVWLASVGATYQIEPTRLVIKPAPKFNDKLGKLEPVDWAATILSTLENEVNLGDKNINEIPLFELLQDLSKRHGLTFVINENSFKAAGQQNIKEEKPNITATQLRGLHLHQFLRVVLDSTGATYLIKDSTIEIVSIAHAAKVTKAAVSQEEDGRVRLNEPLVSAVYKEKPLNEVVAEIAKMYDLTAVVSPQAGDARTGFVTARLLNVPADKALELLALQCDLRVVRRGTTFLITGKDHANELFDEGLEKERRKIELQKLREAKPPIPPAAPEKPPEK